MSPSTDAATPAESAKPRRSWFKRLLWALGVAAVSLGASFGAGRYQAEPALDALRAQVLEQRAQLETLESTVSRQREEIATLEVRRLLHVALLSLEQQNFGMAKGELQTAATLLKSQPAHEGDHLAELRALLARLEPLPAVELATQTDALLQMATKFDRARTRAP